MARKTTLYILDATNVMTSKHSSLELALYARNRLKSAATYKIVELSAAFKKGQAVPRSAITDYVA